MVFTVDSRLLSPRLRRVGFLWVSLTILNYRQPAWGGVDFYGFHCRFSTIVTSSEAGWIFMLFTADSQLLSPRLRRGRFLWVSLQTLNYCHPAWGGVDFYGFHYRVSTIVTPPEVGWIFMGFIADSHLLSPHLRRGGFLWLSLEIFNYCHSYVWWLLRVPMLTMIELNDFWNISSPLLAG